MVERDFIHTRRLDDYARALGYSARTLSRATLSAAGVGAKEYIDRRVILEAERLLAHGDQLAARIGTEHHAHAGLAEVRTTGRCRQVCRRWRGTPASDRRNQRRIRCVQVISPTSS
ncbi:helix-turn-helix domain-containing protein [Streptomyces luteogriseus]|uniref:helix-turn-helix domain-containing protein n=1 Tax=Streptomyces luteogriseus TaxID=68233 RepID=UPI0037B9A0DC